MDKLNDTLLVGPTVHPPLVDVMIRFRSFRIALIADVRCMYRAILLSDKDLHRFVWRSDPKAPLEDFRMTRVTFGVSLSSFIANVSEAERVWFCLSVSHGSQGSGEVLLRRRLSDQTSSVEGAIGWIMLQLDGWDITFPDVTILNKLSSPPSNFMDFLMPRSKHTQALCTSGWQTIPCLELCDAIVLAQLLAHCKIVLDVPMDQVFAWTDSTIVLNWIQGNPHCFKVYVGNRESQIMDFLPPDRWNHVVSADNPADCASRGLCPSEILTHHLWRNGPNKVGWHVINLSGRHNQSLSSSAKRSTSCACLSVPLSKRRNPSCLLIGSPDSFD